MDAALAPRLLYASANGDRWLLLRSAPDGMPVVRHVANAASGGHVTDMGAPAFLRQDRGSPQHQAVVEYLTTLLESGMARDAGR